jgi:hypothetical protein
MSIGRFIFRTIITIVFIAIGLYVLRLSVVDTRTCIGAWFVLLAGIIIPNPSDIRRKR